MVDVEAECPFESRAEAVTKIHQTLISLILVWIGRELVEHGPDRPLQELPPCGHGLVEAGRHQVERSPLEQVEQALVARNPHLDGLGDAGHQVPARQGPQERRIDQYVLGRMEAADEALLAAEVHCSLEADAGVDQPDQRGGHAEVGDPAADQRRGKRDDVGADASSEGNEQPAPVEAVRERLGADGVHQLHRFRLFSDVQDQRRDGIGLLQHRADC